MEKSGIFQCLLSMLIVMIAGCATGVQGGNVGEQLSAASSGTKQEAKLQVEADVADEGIEAPKPKETVKLGPNRAKELIRKKKEQTKITSGLFRTTLHAAKEQGGLALHFSLENISESGMEAVFGSGQMYDIFILNEKGEAVYQWSHDKAFITAIVEKEIKAGEKLVFKEPWDLRDNEGNIVPSDRYVVRVTFLAGVPSVNLDPEELTAEVTVDI